MSVGPSPSSGRLAARDDARILVVDDEVNVSDVVTGALRLGGFDVQAVATGRKALRAVAHGQFELIVLDVALPDLDGFEVCRRLRADGIDTPVLFLTARTAEADATHGFVLGGDDYVRKPFGVEELVARVRALLRRRRGNAELPRVLRFADVEVDLDRYQARRAGVVLDLTPTELRLLSNAVTCFRRRSAGAVQRGEWDNVRTLKRGSPSRSCSPKRSASRLVQLFPCCYSEA